jgi:L-2-hydroxycarboxylate dehydrogenase (NAD+)
MARVSTALLASFSAAILKAVAVPDEQARIITDSVLYAHRRGKGTHGIGRFPIYVRKIQQGVMKADTVLAVVKERAAITVLDAQNGFGQVAGYKGMQRAVEKAGAFGIGAIGIRNSNNFGTAGFVAEVASQGGMIGLVFANSAPAIAPTGGSQPLFGTNPIGIAFPTPEGVAPIVLDMATSVAARGKIRLAAKQGDRIPLGWALDAAGLPTDDPVEALKGSMVPIGGAKGYGLSLAVDVLAGLLTGAGFGGAARPLASMEGSSGYGHLLMAIDIEAFMDREEYLEKIAALVEQVKSCGDRVALPGEGSAIRAAQNIDVVEISSKQLEEVEVLVKELGLSVRLT